MIFSSRHLFLVPTSLLCPFLFASAADPVQPDPTEPPAPLTQDVSKGQIPTVIESDRAEVQTLEEETHFTLTGNVRVTGNNLTVLCDRLEVYSLREGVDSATGDGSANAATEGGLVSSGRIRLILATGNVRIRQEGREAVSGRAEVYPTEGRIVLTESPIIRDEQGTVAGERITFYRGEKRAVVEGGKSGPARITLPTLPDLGVDAETETDATGEAESGN